MADRAISIVRLDASQIDDAAHVLARAFFDAPVWTWVVPDEAQRRDLMPWYMRMALRYALLADETYTTAGEVRGVAIWDPPSEIDRDDPWAEATRRELPTRMGEHGFARFDAMAAAQRPVRERAGEGRPAWYLSLLGVDPGAQRSGIGAALMKDTFARVDTAGVVVLTDTSKPANVPYYERHGFRVVAAGTLPLDGPPFWMMSRPPRG